MKNKIEDVNDKVFKVTQQFLKNPPLIVWGSGATASFGLPSMSDLNIAIKDVIKDFNIDNENLEIELGKDIYANQMLEIKKIIWNKINIADLEALQKLLSNALSDFNGIRNLIQKFTSVHPKVLNIVTTNYDRILEYVMSYYEIAYTDGCVGKVLSRFNEDLFRKSDIVNLIKVHGSLNWVEIDDEFRYMNSWQGDNSPLIIAPGKNKYQEAYKRPYRELIQQADSAINKASSFLIVGFGFNDEHLTPKIRTKIKQGTPIVLLTKQITDSARNELKNAVKYILFEEDKVGTTKVIFKHNEIDGECVAILDGDYWQLNNFMNIL